MPKKLPHNCAACSKLSAPQAREKKCWDDLNCPKRRSYHRNKTKIALERKQKRHSGEAVKTIAVLAPSFPYAHITFYRDRLTDPLHALSVEVRQGGKTILKVQTIDCLGLKPPQIREVMVQILARCSEELGVKIAKYSSRAELPIALLGADN